MPAVPEAPGGEGKVSRALEAQGNTTNVPGKENRVCREQLQGGGL